MIPVSCRYLLIFALVSQLISYWAVAESTSTSTDVNCSRLLSMASDPIALRRLFTIVQGMNKAAQKRQKRSDYFSVGDFVFIGRGENKPFKVGLVTLNDGVETFHTFNDHIKARIKYIHSEDWVVVETIIDGQNKGYLVRVADLELGEDYIPPRLIRAAARIPSIDRKFKVGEKVRVRISGGMRTAMVSQVSATEYEVRYRGTLMRFPREKVFAHLGGTPKSISYTQQANIPPLDFPSGAVSYWLDAMARLTSLKGFERISRQDQLILLMLATRIVLPFKEPGLDAEQRGHETIGDSLRAGYGVCRHLAPIAAALFNETGWPARLMFAFTETAGHVWTEIVTGDGQEWIADPSSSRGFVGRRHDYRGLYDPFVIKYYSNENRDNVIFKSYCPL